MDATPPCAGAHPRARPGAALPLSAVVTVLALLWCGLASASHAAGGPTEAQETAPLYPDETPFMPVPFGQARTEEYLWDPALPGPHPPARIAFQLVPHYALLHLDFLGRRSGTSFHGLGTMLEGDLRLWRELSLRISGSYAAHPLAAAYSNPEETDVVPTLAAPRGVLHVGGLAVGLRYALDFGALFPFVDAGAGILWLISPQGVASGQRNHPCLENNACDTGLVCNAGTCQAAPTPELHAGAGIDWLFHPHLSMGAVIRYHALFRDPGVFPIYLTFGLRLGARF